MSTPSSVLLAAFLLNSLAINGCGGGSGGGGTSTPPPPSLILTVTPSSPTVTAADTFYVTVTAVELNTTATPSITLGTLPAGITTSSTFPMNVPSSGAIIFFTTAGTVPTGNLTVPINGNAGGATASASLSLQVTAAPPNQAYFTFGGVPGVAVAQGASASFQGTLTPSTALYDIALSATGLPSGVTATFKPPIVEPLGTFTVTLTASGAATVAQNLPWSLVGTPAANLPAFSQNWLVDVMPASGGIGWNNQSSYVFTRDTPIAAVYDSAHQLIYAANQVWNRIDLISDSTRVIVKSISIRDPRAMDISIDGSTVWVATGSQVVYGINTATYSVTRYQLPLYTSSFSNLTSWEGSGIFSLADGTLLITLAPYTGTTQVFAGIWNPATNAFVESSAFRAAPWGGVVRSGDGTRIFSLGGDCFAYDVMSKTLGPVIQVPQLSGAWAGAANRDGSRLASAAFGLFDGSFNFIAALPGSGNTSFAAENQVFGGYIFSPDGTRIYEEDPVSGIPVISTIDVATQQLIAQAPAMPVLPPYVELSPIPWYVPQPFAIDSAGMLLGIQYQGIAFDDSTAHIAYSPLDEPTDPYFPDLAIYSGPVGGGTQVSNLATAALPPDVYFGGVKAQSSGTIAASPPASAPGPVDVKILFPDGREIYAPRYFTYGTVIEDAVVSGAGPAGDVPAQLDAFGLPIDPTKSSVTIGGNTAAVTSQPTQYPPFSNEMTDLLLSYTVPPGAPGRADVTVNTPNGSATLSKGFFYANSVNDYATTDNPTFLLVDTARNQVYLSAGNHIDVFSLASMSFATPIASPAPSGSQFQGLAITPDGKTLLATDSANDALAVINPDSPSTGYEIPVPLSVVNGTTCPVGPLYVAPDSLGNAFVMAGEPVSTTPNCGPGQLTVNTLYQVNLGTRTSALANVSGCSVSACSPSGFYVAGSRDGSVIATTSPFKVYSSSLANFVPTVAAPAMQYSLAVSGDGNVINLDQALADPSGNIIGRLAYPSVLFPNYHGLYYNSAPYFGALAEPFLNDAGSLLFVPYPGYVDIFDVQHGTLAMRFALTETVTQTLSPIAIDASGQHMYLITNKGLTVVDLGQAPLAVGHLSPATAGPGALIKLRGSGFVSGTAVQVGGATVPASVTDSQTLTFALPALPLGPADVVLSNPDGTSYTLQNAVVVD